MADFTTNAAVAMPGDMVSISFSATDGAHTLNDAIVVRRAQHDAMTDDDIQAEMLARWEGWIDAITRPLEEEPPPAEVLTDG